MTLDMIPVIFMSFATGLIEELSESLLDIGKGNNKMKLTMPGKVKMETELNKCVCIHKRIKSYEIEIEGLFSVAIFLQGFVCRFYAPALSMMRTLNHKLKH